MQSNPHRREKGSAAYLHRIDGAAHEKCRVIKHLHDVKGPVVEIGPGGGSALIKIAHICHQMGNGIRIVAFDSNEDVLRKLKGRINHEKIDDGVRANIDYISGDASKRLPFENDSVGAINASAVVHEIFSYGGGIPALENFFRESCRVLHKGGHLVYRDPTGANLDQLGHLSCQNEFAYAFLQFFLKKFLRKNLFDHYQDYQFSRKSGNDFDEKEFFVNAEDISADQIPNIELTAYSGLLREITRHYLTFLSAVAPELLFTVSESGKNSVILVFTSKQAFNKFGRFMSAISAKHKERGTLEMEVSREALLQFYAYMREKFAELSRPLKSSDVFDNPVELGETVSPSVLNVIYEHNLKAGIDVKMPDFLKKCCEWAASEGNEYYTYGSPSAVTATALTSSICEDPKSEFGHSCLYPANFDKEHFDLVERTRNTRFLRGSFEARDGGEDELKDRKTVIHFQKGPIEAAIARVGAYLSVTTDLYLQRAYSRLLFVLQKARNLGDIDLSGSFIQNMIHEGHEVLAAMDVEKKRVERQFTPDDKYPHVALAGSVASGKTTVATVFADRRYEVVSLSDFIGEEFERRCIKNPSRLDYRTVARDMRDKFGEDVLAQRAVARLLRENKTDRFVIDGVRVPEEIDFLRSIFQDTILLAVDTPEDVRLERVSMRKRGADSTDPSVMREVFQYEFGTIPGGTNLKAVIERADLVIDGKLDIEETKKRVLQILERGI